MSDDAGRTPGSQPATARNEVDVETTDTSIAVFAPGGYDPDPGRLARATRYFEAHDCRVVEALAPGRHLQRFSGSDAERLQWLTAVTHDPSIDIAMALRGGYGATRLLPSIDFTAMAAAIRRTGKRFVGHSDFTAIQLGLLAATGTVSFAGPMAGYDFGGDRVDPFTETHFWRAMREGRVDVSFPTADPRTLAVEGRLWGGNLTMLCSLVGTRWMPAVSGGVLFIEDINEQPYRIERMLIQLLQAGVLERQSLILCGDFSGYRVAPYDHDYDLSVALAYVQGLTSVPIVGGLPFGHGPSKLTLAVGGAVRVAVEDGVCRLEQRWDLASA